MQLASSYFSWLKDLKTRIRQSQLKAAVSVNTELLNLYWNLGKEIVEKQKNCRWDDSILRQISQDLMSEFPEMKGFSYRNINYIKNWFCFYCDTVEPSSSTACSKNNRTELQQPVAISCENRTLKWLTSIPWGHNILIMTHCKSVDEALFYVRKTLENGWSRSVLGNFLKTGLYEANGKAVTNFSRTLPDEFSDLAQQTLKDPYCFDFLVMHENYTERELEDALVAQVTKFLLTLGSGFAYVGKQLPLQVGEEEFFLDLLFYHLKLRCYVVIELKTGKFHPKDLGQLSFYVTAVDHQMKHSEDSDTIGLLICREKDRIVAEYSLQNTAQPLGISEYELGKLLPNEFRSSLPTVEEIERNLTEQFEN